MVRIYVMLSLSSRCVHPKTLILPLTYHNKDISLICKITGMMTTLNIDHGVEIFLKIKIENHDNLLRIFYCK